MMVYLVIGLALMTSVACSGSAGESSDAIVPRPLEEVVLDEKENARICKLFAEDNLLTNTLIAEPAVEWIKVTVSGAGNNDRIITCKASLFTP